MRPWMRLLDSYHMQSSLTFVTAIGMAPSIQNTMCFEEIALKIGKIQDIIKIAVVFDTCLFH